MASDRQLQGMEGFDKVADGQAFIGLSRGFQVTVSGVFTYTGKSPKTEDVTFTAVALDPPSFIGGPIENLEVGGGGEAAVFPTASEYSIAAV